MNNDRLYSGGAWEKLKVIGRGGSSIVYKGEIKQTGKYVAVKEVMTDGMSADQMRSISGEVDTMKLLDHENIVRCFGLQQRSNKLFIFLEYCDRGSLRHYYQKHGALPELQTANAMLQILRGLQYLHSHGIAHRDVKGANVLLNKQGTLKLADFGASKKIGMESLVSGLKGTPQWMAPEVIKGEQLSEGWIKSDVWSLGCTLVELISGGLPFAEFDNPMTAMYQIASGRAPVLPATSSAEAHSFVATCCAFDPAARPPISELLNHPFITKFVDSSLDSISIGALFNRLAIRSTDFKDIVTEIHADNIEASTGSELNNSAKELVITAVTANEPSFAVSFAEGQLLDGSRDCIFSTHRNDEVSDGSSKNEETMKFPPASLTIKLEPSFRSGMATSASNEELLRNLDTPKVMSLGIFSSRNNSSLDADIAIPNLTDGSNLVEYDLQSTESVFPPEPSQEEELRKADYSIANESEVTKELSDFETFYAVSQARNSSQISSTAPNFFDPSTADKESSDYDARNRSLQVSGVSMPLEPSRMSPRTVKVSPRAKARGAQLNEDSHSAKPSINNRSSPASIDMKPLLTKTKISGSSNFAFDDSISANMVDNAVSNANLKKKIQTEAAATTRLDPVAPVLLMLPQIKDRDRRMNGVKAEKQQIFGPNPTFMSSLGDTNVLDSRPTAPLSSDRLGMTDPDALKGFILSHAKLDTQDDGLARSGPLMNHSSNHRDVSASLVHDGVVKEARVRFESDGGNKKNQLTSSKHRSSKKSSERSQSAGIVGFSLPDSNSRDSGKGKIVHASRPRKVLPSLENRSKISNLSIDVDPIARIIQTAPAPLRANLPPVGRIALGSQSPVVRINKPKI